MRCHAVSEPRAIFGDAWDLSWWAAGCVNEWGLDPLLVPALPWG